MLTGEEVRGCRYSGWSKWPLCAVNILMIRIGSLLAWRKGSAGDGQDDGAKTDGPVRCDSPPASSALRPGDWLRKSGSDPLGESLIWNEARRSSAACDEWTRGLKTHLPTEFMAIKAAERDNPGKNVRMRIRRVGPKLPLHANKYFTRGSVLNIPLSVVERQECEGGKKHSLYSQFLKIPAEVGACETVPTGVRVRSSPSAADSHRSPLPRTEDVKGGIQSDEPPSNHKWLHSRTGAWLRKGAWPCIPPEICQ